ncbi:FAD:protein FMN transferase [Sinomicrobium soli]|uniref:FAD:protein FMN transferase n=1 Tax=Sinomicrobium sp. N-1-3-6 TaxID=2219864 RepID=UPI000DCCCFFB|nr:FAD:protein FMN transferase [Sinomicrobium sp. N-1-3-6]RAV28863.1 FAD:protein FMN transferase [Sinomicrobium sp. N-1-3-6]
MTIFPGCRNGEGAPSLHVITGEAQGSTYAVRYVSGSGEDLKPAVDSILLAIDMSMSAYRPDSDISRINAGDSTVVVDDNFRNVFEMSRTIWEASDGSFDPTIGKLVRAWGFGPDHKRMALDSTKVDSLLQYCGFDKVRLTPENRIYKDREEITFDFNSIAQGYTVDVIGDFLRDRGIGDYVVEVGGELAAHGRNTVQDRNWLIAIDDPLHADGVERSFIAKIKLEDLGMATSGNYRKTITDTITGEQYVHTVDPITGYTKKGNVLSVTVLAKTCMEADAYATTFMVMGLERTKEFLRKKPEIQAYMLYLDENNTMQKYTTAGFEDVLVD